MAKRAKPAKIFDLRTGRKLSKKQVIDQLNRKKAPKIRLFRAGGIKVATKAQLLKALESGSPIDGPIGTLNAPFKLRAAKAA